MRRADESSTQKELSKNESNLISLLFDKNFLNPYFASESDSDPTRRRDAVVFS